MADNGPWTQYAQSPSAAPAPSPVPEGPWSQYAQPAAPSGPWDKFAPPKAAPPAAPSEPEKPLAGFWGSAKEEAKTVLQMPEAIRFYREPNEENRKALIKATESKYKHINLKEIGGVGDLWEYLKEGAGSLAGYVATPAIAAASTTALTGGAAAPAAPFVAGASYLAKHEISNLAEQAREQQKQADQGATPQEVSLGKATAAALGQTAFDVVAPGVFSKLLGKLPGAAKFFGQGAAKVAGETAEEAAARTMAESQEKLVEAYKNGSLTMAGGVAKGVAKGVGFTVPAMVANTFLERWQAGESNDVINDPEAREVYQDVLLNSLVMGTGVGGFEGWLGTRKDRSIAADLISRKKAAEAEAAEKAKQAEEEAKKAAEDAAKAAAKAAKAAKKGKKGAVPPEGVVPPEGAPPVPGVPDPNKPPMTPDDLIAPPSEGPPDTTPPAGNAPDSAKNPTSEPGSVDPDGKIKDGTAKPNPAPQGGTIDGRTGESVPPDNNGGGATGSPKVPVLPTTPEPKPPGTPDPDIGGVAGTRGGTEGTAGTTKEKQPPLNPKPLKTPPETPKEVPPLEGEAVKDQDAPTILDALRKMANPEGVVSYKDALDYISRKAEAPLHRYLATVLNKALSKLEAAGFEHQGIRFVSDIADPYAVPFLKNPRTVGPRVQGYQRSFGLNDSSYKFGSTIVFPTPELYDFSMFSPEVRAQQKNGATSHTVILHELVHAVTANAVSIANKLLNLRVPNSETYLTPHVKELNALQKYIANHIREQQRKGVLTKLEKRLLNETNAFANTDELLAWGLTDKDFQKYLDSIPYMPPPGQGPKTTVWKGLIRIIGKILGLDPKRNPTAFTELLRISDPLLGGGSGSFGKANFQIGKAAVDYNLSLTGRKPVIGQTVLEARKQAPKGPQTAEEFERLRADQLDKAKPGKAGVIRSIKDYMTGLTSSSLEKAIKAIQNDWRPLKRLEQLRSMANSNIVGGKDATNIYTNIVGAMDRAATLIAMHLNPLYNEAGRLIRDYAKKEGLTWNQALAQLDGMRIALHEPERRKTQFINNMPLSEKPRAYQDANGNVVMMSPAERRKRIQDMIADAKVSVADKAKLGRALEALVLERDPLDPTKYRNYDPNGHSELKKGKQVLSDKMYDPAYNVIGGYDEALIKDLRRSYDEMSAKHPEVNQLFDVLKEMQEKGKQFDRTANYWNDYVEGITAAYGWKNYTSFRGLGNIAPKFEARGKGGISGEYAEAAHAFEGRESEAENTILQTMADASRSAARAGRKDVTQILKNLIKAKDGMGIDGKLVQTVTAEERYRGKQPESGRDRFFHFLPNGDIEVYQIKDPELLESIRRPYQESNIAVQMANGVTSWMGKQHTRWNVAFSPMNFTKHTLSNAYNMAGQHGLGEAVDYLASTFGNTFGGEMSDAASLAKAMASGDVAKIDSLRQSKDPFVRSMFEYMEEGGRTTYGQTYSIGSRMDNIKKQVGRNGVLRSFDQVAHYFDAYNDMFDLTSRTTAYMNLKQKFIKEGMTEAAAKELAASQAKELTNYRLIGKYGRAAGGLYMFFRPAASSAVAALDAIRPAFQSDEWVLKQYSETVLKDPAKKKAILENHQQLKQNAKRLMVSLMGAGALLYTMAYQASGDDEQGRNRVAADDKARWTRYARLPILGDIGFFQIPWGFGLGGFGAFGAQVAALANGHVAPKEAAGNMINIAAESFLPLQPSEINPTDNLFSFLLDTVAPSPLRPFLEYAMNRDDMGNEIYNARQGKYSDVFTGGDHIPEGYRDTAQLLYKLTGYKMEVSPNTLYFWATNYFDSIGRVANVGYDLNLVARGQKDFDPKRDIPFTDSFVGSFSNVDAKEWQSIQHQIEKKAQTLNTLKATDPTAYAEYAQTHPYEIFLVQDLHSKMNGELKRMATMRNRIQLMPNQTPKERTDTVKQIRSYENILKHNYVERYKLLDVEP